MHQKKRYETDRKDLEAAGKGFEDKLLEMANPKKRLAAVPEAIGLLKDALIRPTMGKTEAKKPISGYEREYEQLQRDGGKKIVF